MSSVSSMQYTFTDRVHINLPRCDIDLSLPIISGHNLGWHHSGLPDAGGYDDNSCMMGEYKIYLPLSLFREIVMMYVPSYMLCAISMFPGCCAGAQQMCFNGT